MFSRMRKLVLVILVFLLTGCDDDAVPIRVAPAVAPQVPGSRAFRTVYFARVTSISDATGSPRFYLVTLRGRSARSRSATRAILSEPLAGSTLPQT